MDREELASERAAIRGEVDHGPNQAARATAAARATISVGIEAQLAALRQPDARKRLAELATFGALWILGGALVMQGLALPPSAAHWRCGGWGRCWRRSPSTSACCCCTTASTTRSSAAVG